MIVLNLFHIQFKWSLNFIADFSSVNKLYNYRGVLHAETSLNQKLGVSEIRADFIENTSPGDWLYVHITGIDS